MTPMANNGPAPEAYQFDCAFYQLFSSRRRVRIFLMDAEEEEDEDEDDDMEAADISNQSEADQSGTSANDFSQSGQSIQETSQSESNILTDSGTEGIEEGQEDKENTSMMSSEDQSSSS